MTDFNMPPGVSARDIPGQDEVPDLVEHLQAAAQRGWRWRIADLMTEAADEITRLRAEVEALQEPGRGVAIASAMGVSESTISRAKNEHLETICLILAHAGLKVVPSDRVCVDRATYESLTHIATRAMANPSIARQLVWEDE